MPVPEVTGDAVNSEPTLIERAPQLFSLAVGLFGLLAFVLWPVGPILTGVAIVCALAAFCARVWVPIRRRRKHGY